VDGQTEMLDNT